MMRCGGVPRSPQNWINTAMSPWPRPTDIGTSPRVILNEMRSCTFQVGNAREVTNEFRHIVGSVENDVDQIGFKGTHAEFGGDIGMGSLG